MNVVEMAFYSSGRRISARVRIPDAACENNPAPAIAINHGYSGDKNEYDPMAEFLCREGYATLQFDSRGCGKSEADKGRMMCSTEWIEDAYNAVSFLGSLIFVDKQKIGFTGCSMGGAMTIVMAAIDQRLKCAVAISPVSNGKNVLERNWSKFRGIEAYGLYLAELAEDTMSLSLGKPSKMVSVPYALGMSIDDEAAYLLVRDMEPELVSHVPLESVVNSFLLFNPEIYAARVGVPFLIIHGDKDEIVSLDQSRNLVTYIPGVTELIVIRDGLHPLPMSDKAQEVFAYAVDWFNKYLKH